MYIEDIKIAGRSGPVRLLAVTFKLRADANNTLVFWSKCEIRYKNRLIAAPFSLYEGLKHFKTEEPTWRYIDIPISNESIQFIEENRDDDLTLDFELKYARRQVNPSEQVKFMDIISSDDGHNTTQHKVSIPRSQWLRELASLGWSEIEIFEVNNRFARRDKHIKSALEKLKLAEISFREGEYQGTLDSCMQAVDLLGQVESQGIPQKGLDALLFRCFRDTEKRSTMKGIVEAVHKHSQLGADKDRYPPTPFSKNEVRAQLKLTLTLFELFSSLLANNGGPKVAD